MTFIWCESRLNVGTLRFDLIQASKRFKNLKDVSHALVNVTHVAFTGEGLRSLFSVVRIDFAVKKMPYHDIYIS